MSKTAIAPFRFLLIVVPRPRIELEIIAYQATVIPFNYPGIFGGSGEIRTHGTFLFGSFQDCCNKPDSATLPWSDGWESNPRLYGFADRSIGPLWHRHILHYRTVTVTETDCSTFFFDAFYHIFKQDRSKIWCLFYTDAMITSIDNVTV